MQDSVFTKIIKGELPSFKVYEDDTTLAFLDIHPIQPGHTLVIPKKQVEFVWDLDEEDYLNLMKTVKKVSKRLKEVMQTKYVGAQVIGVDVPHAHVNLIPFSTVEEFRTSQDMDSKPDNSELEKIAARIKFN
ncbi:MAG TPA: HIT domain-containing protein [Candidatus Sulfotelmatobacter sp.]|nr:HIT domain-containing protein [Candidatus Sulfotelmatobacter sp.]